MSDRRAWGIFRERTHSPGREDDDARILHLTAAALETRGFAVTLKSPDEVVDADSPPPFVFLMCERVPVLETLARWERAGVHVVNAPRAVLDTYRDRMLARCAAAAVPMPSGRIVSTRAPGSGHPERAWVKRADVHFTQEGDVVFAEGRAALEAALGALAARGIDRAAVQQHVDGDLIKFYGVGLDGGSAGRASWFRWFYHRDQQLAGHPFDPARLAAVARQAAAALGLEVFGGDVIATADGALFLIDLNAWPSFALYREEAAREIAGYLDARFTRWSAGRTRVGTWR